MRQQISSTPTYDMQVWMPHNRLGTGKAEKFLTLKLTSHGASTICHATFKIIVSVYTLIFIS